MTRTLQSEGILHNNLFTVQGDLVEYYNRALEHVIGKKTSLTSFHVDKRGESPEIEAELGQNYLQNGPSDRYVIVVSPDQKCADLLHEEYSFDNEVIDVMYNNNMSGISIATRVDGLYGELNDGVRAITIPEDMLGIRKIDLELHTPSGFMSKARELQDLINSFKKNPELIIEPNGEPVKKLSDLFQEIGDIRGYNITNMQMTYEVPCFYSRIFDGVYVFRDLGTNRVKPKRPTRKKTFAIKDYRENDLINLLMENRILQTPEMDPELSPDFCVVIYKKNGFEHTDGPNAKFIQLDNTNEVMDLLLKNGYVKFSEELIGKRMTRIEDLVLLKKGFDVASMSPQIRARELSNCYSKMPVIWNELQKMNTAKGVGYKFNDMINQASDETKKLLVTNAIPSGYQIHVVENLLTKLVPYDYEKMLVHNKRDLEHKFDSADDKTQNYMISVLKQYNSAK